jgi:hypothetical protein
MLFGAAAYLPYYWFKTRQKMEQEMKESEEMRTGRDAAMGTMLAMLSLVDHLHKIESDLRQRLKAADEALQKERTRHVEEIASMASKFDAQAIELTKAQDQIAQLQAKLKGDKRSKAR